MSQAANKVATPAREATKPVPTAMDVALKKIKNAWIAGLISASLTLVFVLVALGGTSIAGIDVWGFIDIVIVLGLSYGIFRKSRTCAILLLGFFLLNKLIMWSEAGNVSGLPLALVFIWFFTQGIVGTFQYHRLKNGGESAV